MFSLRREPSGKTPEIVSFGCPSVTIKNEIVRALGAVSSISGPQARMRCATGLDCHPPYYAALAA